MIWGSFLLIAAVAGIAAVTVLATIGVLLLWGAADKITDKFK